LVIPIAIVASLQLLHVPDGAFVRLLDTNDAFLKCCRQLRCWKPAGYESAPSAEPDKIVEVL